MQRFIAMLDQTTSEFSGESESDEDLPHDLAELERFVVENDELLQLEQVIGRFNIFDSLGIVRTEIRLDRRARELAGVPDALRPIISNWKLDQNRTAR
jgi:hypothetical protein